jgi:osmoprotectant transport system ATP-binding protein
MIQFTGVSKYYDQQRAVDDLSFTVEQGQVCVLIGPSGCGKTTTLKMVNRMIDPTAGVVKIHGRDVTEISPERLRRGIGYVIQSVGLLPHLNVRDNISIVLRLLGVDRTQRYRRADELLERIGLTPERYRGKYSHELSGGEAQRIGVARALAADPPILLMDEPFGAVDPLTREALQTEFLNLQRSLKKTVMFVTHDIDEAIRVADLIVLMKDGRIVQHDSPRRLLAEPNSTFARDFVGADRALKRLACFPVAEFVREALLVGDEQAQTYFNDDSRNRSVIWVHNASGALVGMLTRSGGKSDVDNHYRLLRVTPDQIGVRTTSSMKEALSRLLGQGVQAVPVLDEQNRIIGEVRLPDIEALNQEIL